MRIASALRTLLIATPLVLTGCASNPTVVSSGSHSSALQGIVRGGQQPVTGATIQLYAAGTTGTAAAATPLLTSSVQTDQNGNFSITSLYTCPSGASNVYLVATGGNPGLGAGTNNSTLAMMAALGPCGTLVANAATTTLFIDEVTTIGSIAALYPYMSSYTALGSSDSTALSNAFSQAAEYTNTKTGTAPGLTLPSGFYASSTEINTLGNIMASCINSSGGVAGDSSPCGNLLALAGPSGGPAPTNTITAVLDILNNPNHNVSGLFSLAAALTPFQPSLSSAPSSWALPILPIAATPTFSVAGGTYSAAQFVTLSDTSSGAIIHYTTDGSTPTSSSPIYSGTITVASTQTIQAIALANGFATSAVGSASYTITGSSATYNVNGQIFLPGCNVPSIPAMTVTLTHGTTTVQTTTSNSSGNFSFSNVPNGTYTLAPSIAGPSSLFSPTTQTIVVSGGDFTSSSFSASLGYTVSGTVAYSGSQTGQIFLALNPTSCGGGGTVGTSIAAKGAYTIHGVPLGSFTLQAFMDNQGNGVPNTANPVGSTSVAVTSSNLTGQNVTLSDPATVTLSSGPTIKGVSGFNTGAVAQFKPIANSSNEEMATSYTLQWSTSSSFTTVAGSKTFPANGRHANVWFLNGLTDGSVYYFRAYGTSAGTAVSSYSNVFGPVTIGAPTGGNTVSGAITFTGSATGPLYVGFLDQNSGNVYGEYFANPVSAQAYTIQAPSSSYQFFGILDQNNNGLIDTGDIQNATDSGNNAPTVISGSTSNLNLTLPSGNATATVSTQNSQTIFSGVTNQSYNLSFKVSGLIKRPVAVTLASGPNLINPVDIAQCDQPGSSCGQGFQIYFNIGTTTPTIGDTYTFNVTYSDGSTGIVTASVTGLITTFATSLAPQTGTSVSTTPTFTWTDPINASNYIYSFSLNDQNGNTIWAIPSNNSSSNGFSSSTTSITWGTDPTGGGSTPTVGSLTLGATYQWQIQLQDSNGNSAQTQVQYKP